MGKKIPWRQNAKNQSISYKRTGKQNITDGVPSNRSVSGDELKVDIVSTDVDILFEKGAACEFSELEPEENQKDIKTPEILSERRIQENSSEREMKKTRNVSVEKKNAYVADKNKKIMIGIILDGTLSFTKVYPKVYYVLEQFLHNLILKKREYRGVIVKYGLTIMREDAELVVFSDGTFFTESEEELIDELRNIQFFGGSADGHENLGEAINQQLHTLNNTPDAQDTYKGIIMFTDSIPKEDETVPEFCSGEPGHYGAYTNYGLRFANFYAYSDDFMPKMRIVDRNGRLVENNRNTTTYNSLNTLLDQDVDKTVEQVQKMISVILSQASVC